MTAEELLNSLNVVSFNYKGDSRKSFGVIAQELEKLFPKNQFSIVSVDDKGYLKVDYAQLVCLLWTVVKTQQEQIDQLNAKINALTETNL